MSPPQTLKLSDAPRVCFNMLVHSRVSFLLLVALLPGAAGAQQVGNEAALFPVLFTPTGAQPTGASDRVWGEVAFTDFLTARLDVSLSKLFAPPPLAGSTFRSSDEWIGLGILGMDAEVGEHWDLHLDGQWSPSSSSQVAVTVAAKDARLLATSDSYGTNASVGYASAGTSRFEWALDVVGGWTHFDTEQRVDAIRVGGPQTAARIRADCAGVKTASCRTLLAALKAEKQVLDQGRLVLLPTVTLFEDTDLTLAFAWYLYAQDPSSLGDFRLATLGRLSDSGTAPLAPMVWTLRPEVTHRLGRVSLTLWWLHGLFTGDNGFTDALGLKVQVKFGNVGVWLASTGNRDVDGTGAAVFSLGFLLGARLRW